MAGSLKILKDGQILFRAGDISNGMFLVRKGTLQVYLEQRNKEVVLAKVAAGGTIGEMALFDRQPRSASVKAEGDVEITHITEDDFAKLMRQIPKWFVGLMGALSSRLRSTNDRLQALEDQLNGHSSFSDTLHVINCLDLVWHRDAVKAGKEWTIPQEDLYTTLEDQLGLSKNSIEKVMNLLKSNGFCTEQTDEHGRLLLATGSRASFGSLSLFCSTFSKNSAKRQCLSKDTLTMMTEIERLTKLSPYENFTISYKVLAEEATAHGLDPKPWQPLIKEIQLAGDGLSLVKTSEGVGFKADRKKIGHLLAQHYLLHRLNQL